MTTGRDRETLREAVHDWFEAPGNGGCVHFDRGYGPYRLCDDPDQGVPIRALPRVFAAAHPHEAPMNNIPEALRLAVELDETIGNVSTIVRPNDDGSIDEVIVSVDGRCVFHLEQMDAYAYWFAVYPPADDRYAFWLYGRKLRLVMAERAAPLARKPFADLTFDSTPDPLRAAAQAILEAALDSGFPNDEIDPGSSYAQSVTLRGRDLWDLRAAISAEARPSLDATWAEAEAALPEGWALLIGNERSQGELGWWATASESPDATTRGGWRIVSSSANAVLHDTPAAALRALAARLAETP